VSMKKILKKNKFIIFILLLSAFLRLFKISDYMEFLGDQGRDVVLVAKFLKERDLMFIGPQTSIGNMYLGPLYYYLMAPFLLFSNFNPVGPAIMVALFSVATTFLIYLLAKKYLNHPTALIASFLYSISPVIIKYSSFSWNPNIMPFFSLLFIWSIYQVFIQKKYKFLILSSISFIFCLNSHYLALLLLPVFAIYFFYYSVILSQSKDPVGINKQFIKYSLYALLLFFLSLLPQILFDIKHNGQNINSLIKFFTIRQTTVNLKVYKAIPQIWPLFRQIITRLIAGKNEIWGSLISTLLFFGFLFSFLKTRKQSSFLLLLYIWLIIGILGLGLYKQHIYDHYFAFLFPIVCLLTANFISFLFQQKFYIKLLAILLLAIIATLSILENPFRFSANKQLQTTQKIVDLIAQKSNQNEFNLALLAKQNYDPPYRYIANLRKLPLYLLADKKTDQLFVICEPWQQECTPEGDPLWDIAAFGPAKIRQQWEINNIKIFLMTPSEKD
ncbi:glycosyltransferase family 39 protein, partial [Patescibacteria group bacterium]|nr:glycosyltransferase family 39 protein [Patescibacteria group bacterium]